jgi:hypothetical protein
MRDAPRRRPVHHAPRLGVLDVLDVLRVLRRGFGDVNRPATDQRAARHGGGQFREGHTNRHKRCSLLFPHCERPWQSLSQHALCHEKRRELLRRQRR